MAIMEDRDKQSLVEGYGGGPMPHEGPKRIKKKYVAY